MADEFSGSVSCFSHTACPHFPCHEQDWDGAFNCLFCYCPLYALGSDCGGSFCYTPQGFKDCSRCSIPHRPNGQSHIQSRLPQVLARVKQLSAESGE